MAGTDSDTGAASGRVSGPVAAADGAALYLLVFTKDAFTEFVNRSAPAGAESDSSVSVSKARHAAADETATEQEAGE